MKRTNIIGKKFGRLLVLEEIKENDTAFCICKCKCGKQVKVRKNNLTCGNVKSCGCFKKEFTTENARKMGIKNRKEMYCRICGKKHYAKGLCKNCYERDRRSGHWLYNQ